MIMIRLCEKTAKFSPQATVLLYIAILKILPISLAEPENMMLRKPAFLYLVKNICYKVSVL